MSVTAGGIRVRILGDDSDLQKTLGDSTKQLAKYGAAAAAAGAAAAAALTVQGLKAVDAQAKLARQLDTSIDGLRALQIAASDAGVSSGVMSSAMERLNARVGEAQRGTGAAADSFARLGLNAAELAGMDVDQRMAAIADAMQNSGLSTSQMADELRQLGIRQGEVVNLMLSGGDAIRGYRQEVDDLGLSLSEVDAAKVEAANDAFSRIGMQLEVISQRLAIEVAPILTAVSQMFTDAAKEAGGFGEATSEAFESVVNGAEFVMDSVDGIKRIFELAADGIIVAWNSVASIITRRIESMVSVIDKIPGIDMTEQLASIRGFAEETEAVVQLAVQNMNDTLMRPMAGSEFKAFVATAREEAQAAAEELQGQSLASMLMGTPEQVELEGEEVMDMAEQIHEKARDEKFRQQKEMAEIEREAARERERIMETEARNKERIMGDALSGLTTLMNSESRKMFEIGKTAAIAQSVVSTYSGMTKALELGWPMGPIAAAAIGASGFANVASIKSQSFGGGGAAGSGGASATQQASANAQPAGNAPAGGTLTVQGLSAGSFLGGDTVSELAEELLEYQRRGGNVVLT